MEDSPLALIQIARGHSFKLGRCGGNGPSLFELNLRAANRLGTTDAFQKAFDTAVRLTEPLKDILFTINGDITTKSHKRRGFVTSTVDAADTHRHDQVAVTSQVVRRSKSRLTFDFLAPSTSMPTPTVTGPSLPTAGEKSTGFTSQDPQTISLSSDMSEREPPNIIAEDSQAVPKATAAEVQSPATQPSVEPQPKITTLSSDDDFGGIQPSANTVPSANQPHPQNTGVPPIPCGNQRNTTQTGGTNRGEPEVLITGVRLRSRPPTRASSTTHNPEEVRITQHGQLIVEQDVDRRFWHISRLQLNGNPACSANITGPNPPRSLCKTKIKSAGLKKPGFGIVAPFFVGYLVDIEINVDTYPQKIDVVLSSFRFNAIGTKGCRQKSTTSVTKSSTSEPGGVRRGLSLEEPVTEYSAAECRRSPSGSKPVIASYQIFGSGAPAESAGVYASICQLPSVRERSSGGVRRGLYKHLSVTECSVAELLRIPPESMLVIASSATELRRCPPELFNVISVFLIRV
ncbi:hypothetical protein R1sor_021985 [Riccia sorocarpa]|uniref:Uncharacterized protein n=1 Tax=Riccia sorocarpa TaxID=122646 RepID=A0ABD3GMU3_9MARC